MRICKLGLLLSGQQWMGDSKRRRHTDRTILWQGAYKYKLIELIHQIHISYYLS